MLGIDLGGASSKTTGYAVLEGAAGAPVLREAGPVASGPSPKESERALLRLIDETAPEVVAIDASLTLPPCLTCPSYCRGPGDLCELSDARAMWEAKLNPVSQRRCEQHVHDRVNERPLPTMQLGVITGRAVALARCLSSRGIAPSVMERSEVLEVYPRATLRRLSASDKRLAPRGKSESESAFNARVLAGFSTLVGGIDAHRDALAVTHTLDAVVAAYTGWLAPTGSSSPQRDSTGLHNVVSLSRKAGDVKSQISGSRP